MSCEVLSIKLCQLDDRLTRLHSRIHISETANQNQLQQEICAMKQECVDSETALQESLRHSKSGLVCVLGQGYRQIEQILQNTKNSCKYRYRITSIQKLPQRKKYCWQSMR